MAADDNKDLNTTNLQLVKIIQQLLRCIAVMFCCLIVLLLFLIFGIPDFSSSKNTLDTSPAPTTPVIPQQLKSEFWQAPDSISINDAEVKYGRALIARTSEYLGPHGKVMQTTNGMNCQNCHLEAGTKIFGNNYSAVAATYPKFRARSGTEETIEKRVNDCIERSLNGKALKNDSREMKAIVSYIKWIGKDVPKGESPKGVGLVEVPFLERAADPWKGKLVYDAKCMTCHQASGDGFLDTTKTTNTYIYPPLWGEHSYNVGAGLFRLSRFAGYVKANMPFGAMHSNPQLTDEEAWDVAAFVNSQPRPTKNLSADWPDISKKPIDHPFGPYKDSFSETQHKYGPFPPIKKAREIAGAR